MRAIFDLQNGFPVCLNLYQSFETSSKKFYFLHTTHSDLTKQEQSVKIITTQEKLSTLKNNEHFNEATKEETALLELIKLIEMEPILFKLETLSKEFDQTNIITLTVEEINQFIQNYHDNIALISHSPIQLKQAEECEFYVFKTQYLPKEHYVIKIGKPEKDKIPLIRIHSSCYTGDLLASLRCDCRDQLQESIKSINENHNFNGGYILYLMQEGRSIGLANKIKAYRMQQIDKLDTVESNLALGFKDDERNFKLGVKILKFFNIEEIFLLTNNPKKQKDLESLGIKVKSTINTIFAPNKHNKDYLEIKKTKMHHLFNSKKN